MFYRIFYFSNTNLIIDSQKVRDITPITDFGIMTKTALKVSKKLPYVQYMANWQAYKMTCYFTNSGYYTWHLWTLGQFNDAAKVVGNTPTVGIDKTDHTWEYPSDPHAALSVPVRIIISSPFRYIIISSALPFCPVINIGTNTIY